MTEQEHDEEFMQLNDTEGLPTAEHPPIDMCGELSQEELAEINQRAEELALILEQGNDTTPINLLLPDKLEPLVPIDSSDESF